MKAHSKLMRGAVSACAFILLSLGLLSEARADGNPLGVPPLGAPPAGNPTPGNPLGVPALGVPALGDANALPGAKMRVPDFVKPGARFYYESMSASDANFAGKPSTGSGITRIDVVSVTETKVLLRVSEFALFNGAYAYAGGSSIEVGPTESKAGNRLWIEKDVLADFKSDQQTQVVRGPVSVSGKNVEATSLTRIAGNTASRIVYSSDTGMLLWQQSAQGQRRPGMTDEFMREITGTTAFRGQRQVDYPWIKQKTPQWARGGLRLNYKGQQTLSSPVAASVAMPTQQTATVAEAGDNWATFNVTTQFGENPAATSRFIQGPASVGYWMDPAVLQGLREGQIDHDDQLKVTLTYQVLDGPAGRLGVVTEASDSGAYQLQWGFNLQDGALTYTGFSLAATNIRVEYTLTGRE